MNRKRKRERAIRQQHNFCFFCWEPMAESSLDLPESAVLISLDPDGAPWPRFMTWPRFVAGHRECAGDFNDARQPTTKAYSLVEPVRTD